MQTWFDAVTDLRLTHQYDPGSIYNMDESGFAAETSQSTKSFDQCPRHCELEGGVWQAGVGGSDRVRECR